MPHVLVIYASTHGHTAKVAGRLAEALGNEGIEVDLRDAGNDSDTDPVSYDGAIVGASLHAGRHQRAMVDWVKLHHRTLSERPSAFLSVSLTAADDTDEARHATQNCIDEFVEETGWTPSRSVPIAGALQYREYDVFTRTLMRLKMRQGGHPTDVARDYDYTDWEGVDRLGREFAASLT